MFQISSQHSQWSIHIAHRTGPTKLMAIVTELKITLVGDNKDELFHSKSRTQGRIPFPGS